MSEQLPFYAPTSSGVLACMAHLPNVERPGAPAIAMLPSIKGERIRIDAYRDAARDLADRGYPVVRFDYPAYGSDPGPTVTRERAREVMGEVADWFRAQAGAEALLLAGGCAGGLDTIQVAAANPRVRRVVVQADRLRQVGKKRGTTVTVGLAAVDPLPERWRPREDRTRREPLDGPWNPSFIEALRLATAHARVTLLFGRGAPGVSDLTQLREEAGASSTLYHNLDHREIADRPLNTTRELADVAALRRGLVEELQTTLPEPLPSEVGS